MLALLRWRSHDGASRTDRTRDDNYLPTFRAFVTQSGPWHRNHTAMTDSFDSTQRRTGEIRVIALRSGR